MTDRASPTARQHFLAEIAKPEAELDLARAALLIAQEEDPELDLEAHLLTLDTIALAVQERLPNHAYPLRILQCLNQYLYQDLGFKGNQDAYYDPRNSLLDQVLIRRTGIPITMAVVYLEIA